MYNIEVDKDGHVTGRIRAYITLDPIFSGSRMVREWGTRRIISCGIDEWVHIPASKHHLIYIAATTRATPGNTFKVIRRPYGPYGKTHWSYFPTLDTVSYPQPAILDPYPRDNILNGLKEFYEAVYREKHRETNCLWMWFEY